MPQEVQFERNVFAGAERVRFYYEVTVVRENQLKAGAEYRGIRGITSEMRPTSECKPNENCAKTSCKFSPKAIQLI
uniref:Uncharacterized protein n=1 Tax=Meloidogyne floridensis TaxID=298350 RepID=A0A915NR24_9BILA